MRKYIVALTMLIALTAPAGAQLTSQQQRMKDCNTQASVMTGGARKQFMSSCLSGAAAETKKPRCVSGKPCGNSCIAKDEVCHK
jgi:psiF repeat